MPNSEDVTKNKDKHDAFLRMWPNDAIVSRKLAEEKQQKLEKLSALGSTLKQAREALGYNVSELTDHAGLSFPELEALEAGEFEKIEQQDYLDYYVHNYATLLGLDADATLTEFQAIMNDGQNLVEAAANDEVEFEDAFKAEAEETLAAIAGNHNDPEKSQLYVNELQEEFRSAQAFETNFDGSEKHQTEVQAEPEVEFDEQPVFEESIDEPAEYEEEFVADTPTLHDQILDDEETEEKPKRNLMMPMIASGLALVLVGGIAYMVLSSSSETPEVTAEATVKSEEKIAEADRAKKVENLETKTINPGQDDPNSTTVNIEQKPLIIPNDTQKAAEEAATKAVEAAKQTGTDITNIIQENVTDVAKQAQDAAKAASDAVKDTAQELGQQVVELPKQTAKPETSAPTNLPADASKYSLRAIKNSWILIEDDNQILFSDELEAGKIFTFPKIKGVIISLADAGIIEVYKGEKLLGKLGKEDASLDLVVVEQLLNQIEN